MDTPSEKQPIIWPSWLEQCSEQMATSLKVIGECEAHLLVRAQMGCEYSRSSYEQSQMPLEKRNGLRTASTVTRQVPMATDTLAMFDASVAINAISVTKLLMGIHQGLAGNDLLVPFQCMRSILEHVALLASTVEKLKKIPAPKDFDAAVDADLQLRNILVKQLYPTRVDWLKMAVAGDMQSLRKEEVGYAGSENEENRTATNILTAIDKLDKQVKGVRVAYEYLCEFSHPNVGALMVAAEKHDVGGDAHGCVTHQKRIGLGAPIASMKYCGDVFSMLFANCAEVLQHHQKIINDCAELRATIHGSTQTMIRHILKGRTDVISPYDKCPCGSGQKFRFCCGSKQHR